MAYTKNPALPRVRREAAHAVLYHGWSTRKAARHFGFSQGAIVQWCKKAQRIEKPTDTKTGTALQAERPLGAQYYDLEESWRGPG